MGVHNTEVYPQIKELLGIPEDEPIFIMRGKDKAALPTIYDYGNNAEAVGASEEFDNDLWDVVVEFRDFKKDHRERMKVPD